MRPLTRRARYARAVWVLATTLIAYFAFCGIPVQTIKTDKATARVYLTLGNVLNPNTDVKTRLIAGGRTYRNLRGSPPFYLDVPGGKRILFVTHGGASASSEVTLHVFDLETKADICVDITDTGFGWDIGSDRKPGAQFTDWIESAQPEKIVVSRRSLDWKHTMEINLNSKTIERGQVFYYDESGHVTNSIMKEGGP